MIMVAQSLGERWSESALKRIKWLKQKKTPWKVKEDAHFIYV